MSRTKTGIIVGVATFLVMFAAMVVVGSSRRAEMEKLTAEQIIENMANAANSMTGEEVGPNVIVDAAIVENGTSLTYYYTIENIRGGDYDRDKADELIEVIKRKVCDDRMMRKAIDEGADINYHYRTDSMGTLFTIEIDQFVCAALG